ncbi:NAD(P)-binding domain-containing protein [Nocardia sp. NPDC050193]
MNSGERATVTVLGTGSMGSALARAFLAAGYRRHVWNRSPERTTALVAVARPDGSWGWPEGGAARR